MSRMEKSEILETCGALVKSAIHEDLYYYKTPVHRRKLSKELHLPIVTQNQDYQPKKEREKAENNDFSKVESKSEMIRHRSSEYEIQSNTSDKRDWVVAATISSD